MLCKYFFINAFVRLSLIIALIFIVFYSTSNSYPVIISELPRLPIQLSKDYLGRFFIQRLVVVAALWRLNTTGAAVLAGAFINNLKSSLPQLTH